MSGRGGNLKQPLKKVLLNVPGPLNLGTYMDTISGLRMLQFKAHGFSLPWTPGSSVVIQRPVAPVAKVTVVNISNVAPIDPLDYEFGFSILGRHRKPGVDNSDFFPHQKFYGGVLPSVTTPVIAAAELNDMSAQIIAQINADNGYNTRRPDYQHPGSAVIAGAPLNLDTWDAASTMTLDGVAVAAAATIAGFVANINALPGFAAAATGATTITVVKTDRTNTAIVFVAGLGTIAAAAAVNGQVGLVQRYDDYTFEVILPRASFATVAVLQNTVFAIMTQDEVFQDFSHLPNLGTLAQETRIANQPLPGVSYMKLVIDIPMQHYDLGGASHGNAFINALVVYVPETEWDAPVNRWEALVANRIMDAGAVSDIVDIFNNWMI